MSACPSRGTVFPKPRLRIPEPRGTGNVSARRWAIENGPRLSERRWVGGGLCCLGLELQRTLNPRGELPGDVENPERSQRPMPYGRYRGGSPNRPGPEALVRATAACGAKTPEAASYENSRGNRGFWQRCSVTTKCLMSESSHVVCDLRAFEGTLPRAFPAAYIAVVGQGQRVQVSSVQCTILPYVPSTRGLPQEA